MAVKIVEAKSEEMARTKKMIAGMGNTTFGEGMEKVNWKRVRTLANLGYAFMPREKMVKREKLVLGGVKAEMTTPDMMTSDNIIFYTHGGGFVSGSAKGTRAYCSMLARFSGMRVVSIDYRLAPEFKYPCGFDDCYAAYTALRELFPESKVCVTGESAGGFYTTALTIRIINNNGKVPECILPQSPILDFTESLNRDYFENKDVTVQPAAVPAIIKLFFGEVDLFNPEVSPIHFKQFDKFPPTMISCDANETLRADADALYNSLTKAGVRCEMYMFEGAFHACSTTGVLTPETFKLLQDNIIFMKNCFGELDNLTL